MLPIADGSDHGGFAAQSRQFQQHRRISPVGRTGAEPAAQLAWYMLAVTDRWLARRRTSLRCSALIAGPHPRAPLSLDDPGEMFDVPRADPSGCRIAWSPTLGGLPVDCGCNGCPRGHARPSRISAATSSRRIPIFRESTRRISTCAAGRCAGQGENYRNNRDQLKETIIWNIEYGFDVTAEDLARAEITRSTCSSACTDSSRTTTI
ncbi:MAG: hypothetical protein R2849_10470 [Thermomicrobiales bacterium]